MINENFEKFENKILDKENTGPIKYNVDKNIEAAVKLQFLCDTYGKERVEEAMKELGINFIDLAEVKPFEKVSRKISDL
jgi:hypothetical protein